MKKQIFKKGDRVFTISYGWLTILSYEHKMNGVRYYKVEELGSINISEKTLSFTEYTLQGFSQERPINYNDYIGEWGFFWDEGNYKLLGKLIGYEPARSHPFRAGERVWYRTITILTPELKQQLIEQGIINE